MTRATDALNPRTRRPGFTLVELMVSAAVCVIIMTILAVAFQSGIDTMRNMKAVGDLQDQLRAARTVMERDLDTDHFDGGSSALSGPRLRDQQADNPAYYTPAGRPAGGFFRLQGDSSNAPAVSDSDGLSFDNSATPQIDHLLHFTSFVPAQQQVGNKPPDTSKWFSARVNTNGTTVTSPVAEIAYFLDQTSTGSTPPTATNPSGVPLYKLVRRQRLVAYNNTAAWTSKYQPPVIEKDTGFDRAVVALKPDSGGKYNRACAPGDLVDLATGRRLGGSALDRTNSDENLGAITDSVAGTAHTRGRKGDDIVLTNVLLFEVRASWTPGAGAYKPRPFQFPEPGVSLPPGDTTWAANNSEAPFDVIPWAKTKPSGTAAPTPATGIYFDTGAPPDPMNPGQRDPKSANVRISSIQIKIRIFDPKTNTARQTTVLARNP